MSALGFSICTIVLLVAILAISIPTLAIVAGRDDGLEGQPTFPYLEVYRHSATGPIHPNSTIPTRDITLHLPIGIHVIQWRFVATGTSASVDEVLGLMLETPSSNGFYSAVDLGTLTDTEDPILLDYTNAIQAPSQGIILESYADIVITASSSSTSYIGLQYQDDDDDGDTLTVLAYDVIVFKIT